MARLKPLPRSQRYIYTSPVPNRGEARRRDKQEQKNVEVTLMDHDAAIMYYFQNNIDIAINFFIYKKLLI